MRKKERKVLANRIIIPIFAATFELNTLFLTKIL